MSAKPGVRRTVTPIRQLREQLARAGEERARSLVPRFERYIEAVAVYCGYRFELAQAHLEAGFEQAAQSLAAAGGGSTRRAELTSTTPLTAGHTIRRL